MSLNPNSIRLLRTFAFCPIVGMIRTIIALLFTEHHLYYMGIKSYHSEGFVVYIKDIVIFFVVYITDIVIFSKSLLY